jgi:hypothetical protein
MYLLYRGGCVYGGRPELSYQRKRGGARSTATIDSSSLYEVLSATERFSKAVCGDSYKLPKLLKRCSQTTSAMLAGPEEDAASLRVRGMLGPDVQKTRRAVSSSGVSML